MNFIDALINLIKNPVIELSEEYVKSKNRANSMGAALEEYIKDLFAGTINELDENIRNEKLSKVFSYIGNQNNPPDAILKLGDALEIKKIESPNSSLALNSSYPKSKIYSKSNMITKACRECEKEFVTKDSNTHTNGIWIEKDIIYSIGVVKDKKLSSLAFIYGMDYAADNELYENIKNIVKAGINNIPNVEFEETKELGRVNRVDPLGITYLRVRGMWGIENPFKVFDYVFKRDFSKKFNCMAIINEDKWTNFENRKILLDLIQKTNGATSEKIRIKDPNNPAKLRNAILITYVI